jgi:uncharacterized protein YggE
MNKIKKIAILVACLILICSISVMSLAVKPSTAEATDISEEIEKPEAHGTVSVSGTASVECGPDQMSIFLKVVGKDLESIVNARDKAAAILDATLKAIEKLNVAEEDIETTSYSLEPVYEWENSKKVFRGYFATVTIKVSLKEKDFSKAGKIIDAAADAKSFVDSIQFELSREKREEIKLELFAEAAKDAKLKAETIVNAIGDTLGNVKSINANNYGYSPFNYYKGNLDFKAENLTYAGSAPPTTILPSDLTITVNINAVFEIM